VVVLDRDLPAVSGDEVCRALAGQPDGPMVLLLTAAAAVEDRLDGLRLGADDYLSKPFAFAELVLRVRALARRGRGHAAHLVGGDLVMDTLRRRVTRACSNRSTGASGRAWVGTGVGLGLSIVQAVARAHDGTIELVPRAANGGGLTVTLRLPVAGQSSVIGRMSNPPAPSKES
jgi:CheY-like chemotaxis protein